MKIKFVTDSSANLLQMQGVDFTSVPLRIVVGQQEFVDDAQVDVTQMQKALKEHKGRTSTACPGVQDWLDAFGDADVVYGSAITSGLSGCYNAAHIAAEEYMQTYPDRQVFILDSLSTGPELELIMEKFRELAEAGMPFAQVCEAVTQYTKQTHLMFSLESLENFAKNGRVSPVVAAAVGILGIRVVGKASDQGTLEPMHKVRGEKKAIDRLVKSMTEAGYQGGKVRISHTGNPNAAEALANTITQIFPHANIAIRDNRALCAYYAETGGVLLGFEA